MKDYAIAHSSVLGPDPILMKEVCQMKRALNIEIKKAYCNKWFWISCAVSLSLSIYSAIMQIQSFFFRTDFWLRLLSENGTFSKNYHVNSETMASFWIGMDYSTWCATAFFFLLPLLASLPYSWSLYTEERSGYCKNMFTRISRMKYISSKYIATFLSGGTVILSSMLVNVLIIACFVPLRTPEVSEYIYYGVYGSGLWADVFYSSPLLYIALYLLLDFIFAGLWATVTMSFNFIKNKIAVLVTPFLLLLIFHYITSILLVWQVRIGLSPLNFIRAANIGYGTSIWIVVAEFAILLIYVIIRMCGWRNKNVL